MFKWILFTAIAISGGILTFLYYDAQEIERIEIVAADTKIASDFDGAIHLIHSYKDGVHHYVGTVRLPNGCSTISANIIRNPISLDQFDLQIQTRDLQKDTVLCSKTSAQYQFAVQEEGGKYASLTAKVNGKPRLYKITEAASGVTNLSN